MDLQSFSTALGKIDSNLHPCIAKSTTLPNVRNGESASSNYLIKHMPPYEAGPASVV
jgi:hypothetical protein